MTRPLIAFLCVFIAFPAIDLVWLGYIAHDIYRSRLGALIAPKPVLWAAIVFYAIYALGAVWFAVLPAVNAHNWRLALTQGAALGFVAYATYDLTNYATLRHWSLSLSLIDLAWGTVLTALVAVIAYGVTAALT
ncbi:MAG: DUF2177 family protein [Hyphomicrobiales bacterium]|nr:DUF2177 family protein [Hyphomicrobiales bacterium]